MDFLLQVYQPQARGKGPKCTPIHLRLYWAPTVPLGMGGGAPGGANRGAKTQIRFDSCEGFDKIDQMAYGEDFFAKQCWDMIGALWQQLAALLLPVGE